MKELELKYGCNPNQKPAQTAKRRAAVRMIYSMPESRLPYVIGLLKNVKNYVEVPPDAWDISLLAEAKKENDGSAVSLDQLAEELNIAL